MIDVCLTNILDYSLERGQVPMDIVGCSDSHIRRFSLLLTQRADRVDPRRVAPAHSLRG